MNKIHKTDAPTESFLAQYATKTGAYTDCFYVDLPQAIRLQSYIKAFYTTPLFKAERFLLKIAASTSSTDQDIDDFLAKTSDHFAVWTVVQRSQTEMLLNAGRTSSWFWTDKTATGTRLYFGSAVTTRPNAKTGKAEMGFLFTALLGFHILYSRALLWSAAKRLA